MIESVFNVMTEEDLTGLEIFHNRKTGTFHMRGTKEWDDCRRWDDYMASFTPEDILTDNSRSIGSDELRATFFRLGLGGYLEKIYSLLLEGVHHGIEFYYNHRLNIKVMYCKSVNAGGICNKRHAIRAGGIRRHELREPEIEVLIDGLNLARAMSYKNALAGIPFGGSKILVQTAPIDLNDMDALGFLAYIIDRTRSFTGPDMGFVPAMTDIMRSKFTNAITGGLKSPMGPTGGTTAYGGYLAIKEISDFIYGDDNLASRHIAIQGLGACGNPLAEYLLKEGATLTVTDLDRSKVEGLIQTWGRDKVKYVAPEGIYTVEADIFAPCAVGGIITEEAVGKFKFRVISGLANNLVQATSKDAEIQIARKLQSAGIFFIVDWALNSAGVLTGWAEYVFGDEATFDKIRPKIEITSRKNLGKLLREAEKAGNTPTELLYEKIEVAVSSGHVISEYLD